MKKTNGRTQRINNEILREVSLLIRNEIKDPRVSDLTSVTRVETTNDLKYCKVFISVLGDENKKEDTLKGLKKAAGFIRKQLAIRINLRVTPEITFHLDDSLESSMRINDILNNL